MFNKKDYYNQKIQCPICEKHYIRSNLTAHSKTKFHKSKFDVLKSSFTETELKLIKKLATMSIDDIQRIAGTNEEEEEDIEGEGVIMIC
jgi:hypothetical protein